MINHQTNRAQDEIRFPNLSLAVYREIAAHLSQVEGVKINLLPASSPEFNYSYSQVESLQIQYLSAANLQSSRDKVETILQYYQNLYGTGD